MSDYLKNATDFAYQLGEAAEAGEDVIIEGNINHIVIAGIGNSITAGMFLQDYLSIPTVISLNSASTAPASVNQNTLFFALSHSGNTEETLSALRDAVRKGAQAVVITSGGKMAHFAQTEKLPWIKLPHSLDPRSTLAYFLLPLLNVLAAKRLIPNQEQAITQARRAVTNPLLDEKAKQLAAKIQGKTPLVYASHTLRSVAYWWKIRFNDNSKIPSFCNTLPELLHSEVAGFEHAKQQYYAFFFYG